MKRILVLGLVILGGCASPKFVAQPLPPVQCGKDLAASYFDACPGSVRLGEGTSFVGVLDDDAGLRKALKDCNVKVKVLQDTIKACQGVQ